MGEETTETRRDPDVQHDVLYAKVSHELYLKIYWAAKDTGFPMTQIIRLCMEFALPAVTETLLKMKEGNVKVK